ncbi:MAG TPA: hypothetical protein VGI06_15430 [Acidimicrobiales bacterium]
MTLIDSIAGALERRTDRRGFLVRAAVVGSALAVDPVDYVLHPGTAYGAVCRCGNAACGCGAACCDGYTEFCCTLTGSNACPPGTFAGGWWRADGSAYCKGPRYYIDCHGECPTQQGPGFCAAEDGLSCGCAAGDCSNRQAGCVTFRYGQCHQEIATAGRIACRVVTCTPAYLLDNSCTTTVMVDNLTANQNRACLQAPEFIRRAYTSAATPDGNAAWLAGLDGSVYPLGSAAMHGSMSGVHLDQPVVGMAATPDGQGYWLVASDGGIFAFGSAAFLGSMGGTPLALPIVGMAATPDGQGYWLVASDGGIFAFGSAGFHGSTGGQPLNALVAGLVPTRTGQGYWIWCQDGSIRPFGDAAGLGDYQGLPSSQQSLPSDGVDAFHALVPQCGSQYTLWAVSPLGPPPSPRAFVFSAAPSTPPPLTPQPPLPPLPGLP